MESVKLAANHERTIVKMRKVEAGRAVFLMKSMARDEKTHGNEEMIAR